MKKNKYDQYGKNKICFFSIYWYSYIAYSNITSKNIWANIIYICVKTKTKLTKTDKNLRINQRCERHELRTKTDIKMNQ